MKEFIFQQTFMLLAESIIRRGDPETLAQAAWTSLQQ